MNSFHARSTLSSHITKRPHRVAVLRICRFPCAKTNLQSHRIMQRTFQTGGGIARRKNRTLFFELLKWFVLGGELFSKDEFHGNTKWNADELAVQAYIWSWQETKHVTDAFDHTREVCEDLGWKKTAMTYTSDNDLGLTVSPSTISLTPFGSAGFMQPHLAQDLPHLRLPVP